MGNKFLVTLDAKRYQAKPSAEADSITNRMKKNGSVEIGEAEFCEAVRNGQTWCGGCFEPETYNDKGKLVWGRFLSLQIIAIDIDNSAYILDANGQPVKDERGHKKKRPLYPGEAGYLSLLDAQRRCEQLSLAPLCIYLTMSARDDWPKYRLVFDLGEPVTSEERAKAVIGELLALFPEADQGCSNTNRLFFGSNGTVKECWRVSGDD